MFFIIIIIIIINTLQNTHTDDEKSKYNYRQERYGDSEELTNSLSKIMCRRE